MTEHIIQAKGVKRGFKMPSGETFWALKGIDMDIPRGKLTILKGRSGSGKTTLLNILGALDDPSEGAVTFNGDRLSDMGDKEKTLLRRSSMGFVFQSVALIPIMTAYENVEYALRLGGYEGDHRKRVLECLDMVGLSARADHMPQEMSGGEQQRVAIARAIAHGPQVVFADEPTGELDTNTAISVVKIFKELNASQNITVVMTTHDTGFMQIGDCVYALEDGELKNE